MSDKVFDFLNIAPMVVIMIIILYPLYFCSNGLLYRAENREYR